MADIQMCVGNTNGIVCPIRMTCYRFTAPASPYWQAFGPVGENFTAERGCKDYIKDLRSDKK
jgi:hypothetical protein